MTLAEVNNLLANGFTHDEIMAFANAETPSPVPAPVPVPVPAPAPVPVPEPKPDPVPAPVPEDKNDTFAQQLGEMSKGINTLVQLVQNGNILSSRAPVPEALTGESALAQILKPLTKEPIGGTK